MPHRHFLGWCAWLESQWNIPDRHDHYVMRATVAVMQGKLQDQRKATMDKARVTFQRAGGGGTQTREGAAAISKAIWGARLATAVEGQKAVKS